MTKSDIGTRLAELVRREQAAVKRVESASVGLAKVTAARDAKLRDLEVAVDDAARAYTDALLDLVTTSGMQRAAAVLDMKPAALRKLTHPAAPTTAAKQPTPEPEPETTKWVE
jgi:hypothetical protein